MRSSRHFHADDQPDVTMLIRRLSMRAGGDVLGRAFQGHAAVRRLTEADHQLLAAYAARLPLEPRARLVPEERLEALLLAGDEASVEALMRGEEPGLAEERRRYLMTEAIRRDRQHVEALRDLYDGRCQICEWAPRARYGADVCEGHHVRWLSRGGQDDLSNMVLVCPNHHRAIHRIDAPFDFSSGGFLTGRGVERLALSRHDLGA